MAENIKQCKELNKSRFPTYNTYLKIPACRLNAHAQLQKPASQVDEKPCLLWMLMLFKETCQMLESCLIVAWEQQEKK